MSADEAGYVLYGVPGWGSALVEAALARTGAPFGFVDVAGFDAPSPARDRLLALNPLAQVPTLALPDGTVMTESAAIALHLAETHPEAGLAPCVGDPTRPEFLRRLVWLVAGVYATFTLSDYPERFAPSAPAEVRDAADAHRERLWSAWEAAISPAPWALGERLTALDLYVGVMTRWRPGRAWFDARCPKLAALARRVEAEPDLRPVFARNFPQPRDAAC